MGIGIEAYILLGVAALAVSGLTLFSGFGLGTLLMPAFIIFFPVNIAIAATALVHLANNLFKLGLLWRRADWSVVARFAVPAAVTAIIGATLLAYMADLPVVTRYFLGQRAFEVTIIKLVISLLILFFALLALIPALEKRIRFRQEHLLFGAALSGFFGGLSGHQGALRSAVLIRLGLQKQSFIATGVVCAVIVDFSRLAAYGTTLFSGRFDQLSEAGGIGLVGFASLASFTGAFAASRAMGKVTMKTVQQIVGIMLILLSLSLGTGIL